MSLYRIFISVAAGMSLATCVYANVQATDQTQNVTEETKTTYSSTTETTQTVEKLDINKASLEELKKVKGLNTSKAKAIINYRAKHGSFKSLDELKNVKGFKRVKEKRMKEVQDQLTIG